jgi:hypothetical protein
MYLHAIPTSNQRLIETNQPIALANSIRVRLQAPRTLNSGLDYQYQSNTSVSGERFSNHRRFAQRWLNDSFGGKKRSGAGKVPKKEGKPESLLTPLNQALLDQGDNCLHRLAALTN